MLLNSDNYFSLEANRKYLSVSQYKSFVYGCEARAMAQVKGEWFSDKSSDSLLFGSLLHSWNESEEAFEHFKNTHPQIFSSTGKTKGQLKSTFKKVYDLIDRIKNDKIFEKALQGKKEVIFTSNMFGVPWKICIDSYNPDEGYFTDLKSMAGIYDKFYSTEYKTYVNFIMHYKYDIQMIVYSEIERLATKREKNLVPYLAVVTKQEPPDACIFKDFLEFKDILLAEVERNIPRIIDLKAGLAKPKNCNKCDYCRSLRSTPVLSYKDLYKEIET